jgi:hypothetical protein
MLSLMGCDLDGIRFPQEWASPWDLPPRKARSGCCHRNRIFFNAQCARWAKNMLLFFGLDLRSLPSLMASLSCTAESSTN